MRGLARHFIEACTYEGQEKVCRRCQPGVSNTKHGHDVADIGRYGAIVNGWLGEPVRMTDAVFKGEDHHACIHL
jgi:hypothetical protein